MNTYCFPLIVLGAGSSALGANIADAINVIMVLVAVFAQVAALQVYV